MAKEQLCWACQKACGDCSYRIEKCPEYVPDKKG